MKANLTKREQQIRSVKGSIRDRFQKLLKKSGIQTEPVGMFTLKFLPHGARIRFTTSQIRVWDEKGYLLIEFSLASKEDYVLDCIKFLFNRDQLLHY